MPIRIETREDEKGGVAVHVEGSGPLSGAEVISAYRGFLKEEAERFRRCRTWLADYSDATDGGVEIAELRELADLSKAASRENPNLAMAVVVAADLPFGLGRMWQAFSDETGWRIRVFRSLEEARRWLEGSIEPR